MLQIVRYNWPAYVVVAAFAIAAAAIVLLELMPRMIAVALVAAAGAAVAGAAVSLAASYWIYDRSELRGWDWIRPLVATPRRWANLTAGLDETSLPLRRMFPGEVQRTIDICDPENATGSIRRARRMNPPPVPAEPARPTALPFGAETLDAAFLIFAAHEVRDPAARVALFHEISRALAPGGQALLVEHVRDPANFLAFGPGALHFFSRSEWLRTADAARLRLQTETSITPFVRAFVFSKT